MYSNKGFSLIELMIVVGIIGILALMGIPVYDNYVMRVKLAELNFEIMGKYRYLQTELMSAGEKDAAFNIAAELCDSKTITTRKGGYGDNTFDVFECDMRPNTSLFPVITKLTTYSSHYQKDDSVVYLHYEETAVGNQVWMRIQGAPEGAHFSIMIPPEIAHKYVGNRASKSWYKTFRVAMWRHGIADLDRFEDNENVAGFVAKVIEKGETNATKTKAGKWYCAYASTEPYYYLPPIQARPSGCKSTYSGSLIIE